MRTKSIIIGSILLLVGGVVLQWVLMENSRQHEEAARYRLRYGAQTEEYLKQYNEWLQSPPHQRAELPLLLDEDGKAKSRAQLWQEQQERLKADMEKLATGEMEGHPLADVLYGENWQQEVDKYKKQRQLNQYILIGSAGCTSLGGLVCLWWTLVWLVQQIAKGFSRLRRLCRREHGDTEMTDNKEKKKEKKSKRVAAREARRENKAKKPEGRTEKSLKAAANTGWQNPALGKHEPRAGAKQTQKKRISREVEKIAMLLSDENSDEGEIAGAEWLNPPAKRKEEPVLEEALPEQPILEEPLLVEEPVSKEPAEHHELPEQPEPYNHALVDINEQISAIREYTAYQQDRLKKLQDGYDWNIIRTFCLRIIRCIDNLDSRIGNMSADDVKAMHLGEVRDELIFALESSGIEQFEPQMNSEYRGQEKCAEAVKEKEECDDPAQAGRIANVIRPGYQYFINEDTTKVVRPAQVKLYA